MSMYSNNKITVLQLFLDINKTIKFESFDKFKISLGRS